MKNNKNMQKKHEINTNSDKVKNKKPSWLRVKASGSKTYLNVNKLIKGLKLNTVCEEAACPNIGECWDKKHATFMILGSICTRACAFCNIKTGIPNKIDINEPINTAEAVAHLDLKHVVITSVDRDDLPDGGASQFIKTIQAIRNLSPNTTIEILTPDFLRKDHAIEQIVESKPDVFNHNVETVPSLYKSIRPGARYFHSLSILQKVKSLDPNIFTKSGFMVGLGETTEEIKQLLDDMRTADIDFVTIGQYLQPTKKHAPVKKFVTPEEFKYYKTIAESKGFLLVSSSPLTRSSYHADESFKKLREKRQKKEI